MVVPRLSARGCFAETVCSSYESCRFAQPLLARPKHVAWNFCLFAAPPGGRSITSGPLSFESNKPSTQCASCEPGTLYEVGLSPAISDLIVARSGEPAVGEGIWTLRSMATEISRVRICQNGHNVFRWHVSQYSDSYVCRNHDP